jgi:hypothetical protein
MANENPYQAARRKQHPVTIIPPPKVKKITVPPRKKR